MRAAGYLGGIVLAALIQYAFRAIPRVLGKRISPADTWLWGPIGGPNQVGRTYYAELAREEGLALVANDEHAGLLPDLAALRGPGFNPDLVNQRIRDFYEHTARYRLRVEARWSLLFLPFGWLLVGVVSRRIAQLNFPVRQRDTAGGMTSEVLRLCDSVTGEAIYSGWLRTQASSGRPVYVGLYGITQPPRESGPCVRVVFPLPFGSSTVLLRPGVDQDASFHLNSNGWRFGQAGYYRIHEESGVRRARYIAALREHFHVWVDPEGVVHAEHDVRFFRILILRLLYVMENLDSPDPTH